jgi:hypothetical protein
MSDPLREQLSTLAAETRPPHPLPAAGTLWWKAEILRRLAAEEKEAARARRPAVWGQAAGLAVGAAAVTLFLALRFAGPLLPLVALFASAQAAGLMTWGLLRR